MDCAVSRFGAFDLMLGTNDFVAAARYFGNGAGKLSFQLGDLEDSEGLPLVDAVADVDVNMTNKTGDFGMDIDGLIGLELSGEGEDLVDVAALDQSDLRRWILRSVRLRT